MSPVRQKTAWLRIVMAFGLGFGLFMATLWLVTPITAQPPADPIDPPAGYPKLLHSTLSVTPTLIGTGGADLTYLIELRNTGAYTAEEVTLTNPLPEDATYNNDATVSDGSTVDVSGNVLSWAGEIGFDTAVWITYTMTVDTLFEGFVVNSAVVSETHLTEPLTLTAETLVTSEPFFTLTKEAWPEIPGANKPLTYTITARNIGQSATDLTVVVTDVIPADTTLLTVGTDGTDDGTMVTWTRNVTLATGEETIFTFSVTVDNVVSGTVITNDEYGLSSAVAVTSGEPVTVTVIDPILSLSKHTWPDPPGSNREMTYYLTVLNSGSLATNVVITDEIPANVTYVEGGTETAGVVEWVLPILDTNETAEVTYTVFISDIAEVEILNENYGVCTDEGVCVSGSVLTSVVEGPNFVVHAILDPIAKKPGGGGGPVTPTLVLENIGPGNAIDAQATLLFDRISVSANDLYAIPNGVGTPPPYPGGPDCGDQCVSYVWVGSLDVGDVISFTTIEGQSTIGGSEGTNYTATIVVTDELTTITTDPITATEVGTITHFSNLIPSKTAPAVIGAGQVMTYYLEVWNSALTTDAPPVLTDTVPAGVTLLDISDDGVEMTVGSQTVVSWTLPDMGAGDRQYRWFSVQVDEDLVSGTLIVNENYGTSWLEETVGQVYSQTGQPVTTTVYETGLIDSYKVVTPTLSRPGDAVELTYYLHVVNSSPLDLTDVHLYDWLPWEHTTYQRDAIASSGDIISDIVSLEWTGDVAANSEEVITLTVIVDPDFDGAITNTAVISHESLAQPITITAVAYVTDLPVLHITKVGQPQVNGSEREILYTITVENLGQEATQLVISDVIPAYTTYIPNSASAGGVLVDGAVQWERVSLASLASAQFTFRVQVDSGRNKIINASYGVTAAEGVTAYGVPVITYMGGSDLFLPVINRQ